MLGINHSILWLIGITSTAIVVISLSSHFSAETRERRRRDRSNRPVISRKQGPTVRLAVDVAKPKRGRKR